MATADRIAAEHSHGTVAKVRATALVRAAAGFSLDTSLNGLSADALTRKKASVTRAAVIGDAVAVVVDPVADLVADDVVAVREMSWLGGRANPDRLNIGGIAGRQVADIHLRRPCHRRRREQQQAPGHEHARTQAGKDFSHDLLLFLPPAMGRRCENVMRKQSAHMLRPSRRKMRSVSGGPVCSDGTCDGAVMHGLPRLLHTPDDQRKRVHRWRDGQRVPDVRVL